jgi:hypothetical protein
MHGEGTVAQPTRRKKKKRGETVGFLGVGLDQTDGHRRITTGENFLLIGGSEITHERMIDTATHVNEQLRRRGKSLGETSPEEVVDLFRDAASKQD